jgi:hypothetical protein
MKLSMGLFALRYRNDFFIKIESLDSMIRLFKPIILSPVLNNGFNPQKADYPETK